MLIPVYDLDVLSNATLMIVCLFCRWYIGGVLLLSSICILYMYVLHDNVILHLGEHKEDVETAVMKTSRQTPDFDFVAIQIIALIEKIFSPSESS